HGVDTERLERTDKRGGARHRYVGDPFDGRLRRGVRGLRGGPRRGGLLSVGEKFGRRFAHGGSHLIDSGSGSLWSFAGFRRGRPGIADNPGNKKPRVPGHGG